MSVSTRVDDLEILESPAAPQINDHFEIVHAAPPIAAPPTGRLLPILALELVGLVAIVLFAFVLTSGAV
jgi:hypothetical protein